MAKFKVEVRSENKIIFAREVDAEDANEASFLVLEELKTSAQATAPAPWDVSIHPVADA